MTRRGREALDLEKAERVEATWLKGVSCELASIDSVRSVPITVVTRQRPTHSHTYGLGVCTSLTLIPDQDIHMGQQLLQLNLEELWDERRRQVQHHSPSPTTRRLCNFQRTHDPMGQEVSLDVEVLRS